MVTTAASLRHLMDSLQAASTIILVMTVVMGVMKKKILIISKNKRSFSRRFLYRSRSWKEKGCMGVRYHLGRRFLGIWRRFKRRKEKKGRRRKVIMLILIILIKATTKNQRKKEKRNQPFSSAKTPSKNFSTWIKTTTRIPWKIKWNKCERILKPRRN